VDERLGSLVTVLTLAGIDHPAGEMVASMQYLFHLCSPLYAVETVAKYAAKLSDMVQDVFD
jgi:hypothetical protein